MSIMKYTVSHTYYIATKMRKGQVFLKTFCMNHLF